jgi:hypothetical protein
VAAISEKRASNHFLATVTFSVMIDWAARIPQLSKFGIGQSFAKGAMGVVVWQIQAT